MKLVFLNWTFDPRLARGGIDAGSRVIGIVNRDSAAVAADHVHRVSWQDRDSAGLASSLRGIRLGFLQSDFYFLAAMLSVCCNWRFSGFLKKK